MLAVANTGPCVRLQNKIGHHAHHCRQLMQVAVSARAVAQMQYNFDSTILPSRDKTAVLNYQIKLFLLSLCIYPLNKVSLQSAEVEHCPEGN